MKLISNSENNFMIVSHSVVCHVLYHGQCRNAHRQILRYLTQTLEWDNLIDARYMLILMKFASCDEYYLFQLAETFLLKLY